MWTKANGLDCCQKGHAGKQNRNTGKPEASYTFDHHVALLTGEAEFRAEPRVFMKFSDDAFDGGRFVETAIARVAIQILELTRELAGDFFALLGGKLGVRKFARDFVAPITHGDVPRRHGRASRSHGGLAEHPGATHCPESRPSSRTGQRHWEKEKMRGRV